MQGFDSRVQGCGEEKGGEMMEQRWGKETRQEETMDAGPAG